jgi:hypothetical protein
MPTDPTDPTDQTERSRASARCQPARKNARGQSRDEFGLTHKTPISNTQYSIKLEGDTKNRHNINDSKAPLLTSTSLHRLQVKVTPHDDTGSSSTRAPTFMKWWSRF